MENVPNWAKDLTIKDLPNGDMKMVAEFCGMDVAISLIENLPCLPLYIPDKKRFQQKYIKKNFDGSTQSAKKLALECDVSLQHVRDIFNNPEIKV